MKNTSNKRNTLPLVTSNPTGKIFYINDVAISAFFGLNVGDSIIPKVDESAFYKNTMNRNKMDLIYARDIKYNSAIMKVITKHIFKMVELVFLNDNYFFDEQNREKIKKMFLLFTENISYACSNVKIDELVEKIIEKLSISKELAHKRIIFEKKIEAPINLKPALFDVVLLSCIALMNELDFCVPVSIKLEKSLGYTELVLSQELPKNYMVRDINTFSFEYQALAPRIEFLNSLCEREKLTLEAIGEKGSLTMKIKIPDVKDTKRGLKAHTIDVHTEARMEHFISMIIY